MPDDRLGDPDEFAALLLTLMDESPIYKSPHALAPRIGVKRQTISDWLYGGAQVHSRHAGTVLQALCEAFELEKPLADPVREKVRQDRRRGLYHLSGYSLPEEIVRTSEELRAVKPAQPPQTPDKGSGKLRRPARLQPMETVRTTDELGPIPPSVQRWLDTQRMKPVWIEREESYVKTP